MSAIETPLLLASSPPFEPGLMNLDERPEIITYSSTHFSIPCAICIVHDDIHDMMSRVRRSVYGTMRCYQHTLECANCHGEVETDAQLLCSGCSDSVAGAMYQEILLSTPEARMCLYDFVSNPTNASWICGCPRCMQQTAQFFIARSIEEGCASLSSPPLSPNGDDEEHISFQVANNVFN